MEKLLSAILARANRESVIQTEKGPMIYVDASGQYVSLLSDRVLLSKNIESFEQAVLDKVPEKASGYRVRFDGQQAATLWCPDQKDREIFQWAGRFSQQFKVVKSQVGKVWEHIGFMRLLTSLKPSIKDYTKVCRKFEEVFISYGEGVKSTLKEITTTKSQPSNTVGTFMVAMPIIDGDKTKTEFEIEVDCRMVDGGVRLGIIVPAGEQLEENAWEAVIDSFVNKMRKVRPRLLVVR